LRAGTGSRSSLRAATPGPGNRLARDIDGIVGAALSDGAMDRMARVALYFDRKSRE